MLAMTDRMAITDRMGDCFVPRNDGKARNDRHNWNDGTSFLRHCEKTPVDVYCLDGC